MKFKNQQNIRKIQEFKKILMTIILAIFTQHRTRSNKYSVKISICESIY